MKSVYSREQIVGTSWCDSSARLSWTGCFGLFQDLAGEHAQEMGCGISWLMERGLFWVTSKTLFRVYRRPEIFSGVTVETWPEPPGRLRCNRDYRLTAGGELLAEGKTEFVLVDLKNGGMRPPTEAFPQAYEFFSRERVCPEPFHRFPDTGGWELFSETEVGSTDIDLGGHMNNVAYVRMLERQFSTAEWKRMEPREMELHYRSSCYEGERLRILRRESEADTEFRVERESDGKLILLALLRRSAAGDGSQ